MRANALMLSITCQKSDFLMPSNGIGCIDKNSFNVYFNTPWKVVFSRGRLRKSDFSHKGIVARFELQFWNRGIIADKLARRFFSI